MPVSGREPGPQRGRGAGVSGGSAATCAAPAVGMRIPCSRDWPKAPPSAPWPGCAAAGAATTRPVRTATEAARASMTRTMPQPTNACAGSVLPSLPRPAACASYRRAAAFAMHGGPASSETRVSLRQDRTCDHPAQDRAVAGRNPRRATKLRRAGGAIGVQEMRPGMHPKRCTAEAAFGICRPVVIGETGFVPATARPPAGFPTFL